MGFIYTVPEGMSAAGASTDALAAQAAGHTAQAAAAGMVVPPGLDPDISPVNVAKISAYAGNIAAALGLCSTVQMMYGTSVGVSGVLYSLEDALSAAAVLNVV